jgi:DNA-binding protein H-NS
MTRSVEESLGSLQSRLLAIQAEIEAVRRRELDAVLLSVRQAVAEYGFTERDIFGRRKLDGGRDNRFGRVMAKYRNPETGATWTGRGRAPRWIQGKCYASFLIGADVSAGRVADTVRAANDGGGFKRAVPESRHAL